MENLATLALAVSGWLSSTQEIQVEGNVKYYVPTLMAKVAVNRGYILEESEYDGWLDRMGIDGAASLMRVGDIGRFFTIVWPDGTETRHLSIDCVEFKHFERRVEIQNDVGEVDWRVAQMMDMKGPVHVKIVFDVERDWGKFRPE